MTNRMFELPQIQDLSKEQEAARALPKTGQYLIVGGPGTGKSVLALLRARRHAKAEESHVFLVYNRLLHEASHHLGGQDIICQQWMSWFFKVFSDITHQPIPRMPTEPGTSWQEIDWEKIYSIMSELPTPMPAIKDYIIIDEGQDMPPHFYDAISRFGYENLFVVADQNQQIVSGQNSSREDIRVALAIEPDEVIELTKNFRNNASVAKLATQFYPGDPASPPIKIPKESKGVSTTPILFSYQKKHHFQRIIWRIIKKADIEPAKLIGIIAPNNDIRNVFFQALQNEANQVGLDNPVPFIRTYCKGVKKSVKFDEGGIMVINAQACKGLEFDHVFIVDINAYHCYPKNIETIKRLFYVMVARARENVTLLRLAQNKCPVDRLLPDNNNILQHYPRGTYDNTD
jgi:DNA helicase II / ATP-dependent DNA helicase PcrA